MRAAAAIFAFLVPTSAVAADRAAVQKRDYSLGHELTISLGMMPSDPFHQGWTAGISYTVHLDDTFAWEIVSANAAYLAPTALRQNLIANFGKNPDEFSAPRAVLTTGLVFSPLYGKLALLDGAVIHQALFVGAYAGVISGDRPTLLETLRDVRPSAGLGIGYRVFLSTSLSVRIDARDLLSIRPAFGGDGARLEQVISISVGLAFSSSGGAE